MYIFCQMFKDAIRAAVAYKDDSTDFMDEIMRELEVSILGEKLTSILYPLYGKCSKISNTFLFLISNKMMVNRTEIHKIDVRIPNRKDLYQTACLEAA